MSLKIKTKVRPTKRRPNSPQRFIESPKDLPFLSHLVELRNRLVVVAICVCAGALLGYGFQKDLINVLIKPANGQHFIYTSPIGGVGFLFSLTTDFGILLCLPIIFYQILKFINPALKRSASKTIIHYCIASGIMAFVGVALGYLFGLPLVLKFLSHPFSTRQIQPLFTITEYLSFVSYYLFAAALILEIPVILLFINRIKPLKPKSLLHYERHVIVVAFIISAIMAPTINVIDLFVIAGPIIVIYNLGVLLIWRLNAGREDFSVIRSQDLEAQRQRQSVKDQSTPIYGEKLDLTTQPNRNANIGAM